jgi:spore maturation protein SpmA
MYMQNLILGNNILSGTTSFRLRIQTGMAAQANIYMHTLLATYLPGCTGIDIQYTLVVTCLFQDMEG